MTHEKRIKELEKKVIELDSDYCTLAFDKFVLGAILIFMVPIVLVIVL